LRRRRSAKEGSLEPIRIGSRGSPLARWQVEHVAERLRAAVPGRRVEIEIIRTSAEKFPEEEPQAVGVGMFTREIDEELLARRIDLAVHSLKDIPSQLHPELTIAAVPAREVPLDAFVGTQAGPERPALWDLPEGSVIGTGSPRRKAQLLHRRPDLKVVPLRGNVETRIRKAREGSMAGIILAQAGLRRLGREELITHSLPCEWLVPAVGQGALAVTARSDRAEMLTLAAHLEHPPTRARITAERAFLAALRGGCQVPAGALAEVQESPESPSVLWIIGVLASLDGERCIRGVLSGPAERAEEIGRQLAEDLLGRGGREVLEDVRAGVGGGGPRT
jgi:hydroxymethylbilane synthase